MKKKLLFLSALFVVCLSGMSQTVFKHIATTATISNNFTTLNNSATNNHPESILIITPDYGSSGPYLAKSLGVWYSGSKWTIFTQDRSPMLTNARFNILAVPAGTNAFVYTISPSSISGHIAIINHPSLNNKPEARILVTQNWGSAGVYNNHPIGVYYHDGYWRVFNQDREPIPPNSKFNIYIDSRTFEVQATSPSRNWFKFSNASTDDNPDALVFCTQRWTSVYNPNETGVWFNSDKWTVFNQNKNALPRDAKFNVLAFGGTAVRRVSIPSALWRGALNSLLSTMQVRINNLTNRDFEFTSDNTFKWYKPNDCSFRIGTGAFVLDTTFDLKPFRLEPMTIYIQDFNKRNTVVSAEAGKIKVRVNFEQDGLEIKTNCIDNFGCAGIGNPNFNFINPAIEILIRPVVVGGRISYDNAEVRLFGSLSHDGVNLSIEAVKAVLGLFNFEVNNELRTRGSAFMTTLLNSPQVKQSITDGLNANLARAASFGFAIPENITGILIDAAGNMIITRG